MTQAQKNVLGILSSYFSDKAILLSGGIDWYTVFEEMKQQTVIGHAFSFVESDDNVPSQLKNEWEAQAMAQYAFYFRLLRAQDGLLELLKSNNISAAILKGYAVAECYPMPHERRMGDIDFLVKKEDFDKTYRLMLANGYTLTEEEDHTDYHYSLSKGEFVFELHLRPAGLADDSMDALFADGLDNVVSISIDDHEFTALPALQNGLVLLLHMLKHLKSGIGLRHVIDWMMYVGKYLSDDDWDEFKAQTDKAGITTLAITVTRMCRLYLGLTESITWCCDADDELCGELMEYIMSKGNFGAKEITGDTKLVNFLTGNGPIDTLKKLQRNSVLNWEAAQKHHWLRPFAIFHSAGRYAYKLIKIPQKRLGDDVRSVKRRNEMFKKMGI